MDRTRIAQEIKARIVKWVYIKEFCTEKETINRMKTANRMGENICQLFIWQDKYPQYIKKSLKKTISQQKWANDLNRYFSKGEIQMPNKYIKMLNIFSHWKISIKIL
jgi:hypothetical protein